MELRGNRRSEDLDYAALTKIGFGLGVGLFLAGAIGEFVGHAYFAPLPGWETALLFDLEVLGILLGLFSPILFGAVLPLME
jgi:uncharacterized membrane protein YGL010W